MAKKKAKPGDALGGLQLSNNPKEAQSIREIMKATGMKSSWVQNRLREFYDAGTLRNGRRDAISISGQKCRIPVYWVED